MKKKIIGIFALGLTALTVTACGTSAGGTNQTASTTTSNSTTASTTTSNATNTSTTQQTTTYSESSNTDMVNEIDKTFKEVINGETPLVLYRLAGGLSINGTPGILVIESGTVFVVRSDDLTFGELSKMSDDEIINLCKKEDDKTIGDNLEVFIITDETGNNVAAEGFIYHYTYDGVDCIDDVLFSGVTNFNSGTYRPGEFDIGYILDSEYISYNSYSYNTTSGSQSKSGLYHRPLPSENGLHVNIIQDDIGDSDIWIEYPDAFEESEFEEAIGRLYVKYKEKYGYK